MDPLFASQEEYDAFRARHDGHNVKSADLSTYEGNCYLGIDAGSTTTKIALVGEDGSLLYSFYSNNNGSPLATAIRSIKEIYTLLPPKAKIVHSCSTGYGEALLKAALMLDDGEVETVAHFYAAAFFDPEVDCILDIGGQDMKCIKIRISLQIPYSSTRLVLPAAVLSSRRLQNPSTTLYRILQRRLFLPKIRSILEPAAPYL